MQDAADVFYRAVPLMRFEFQEGIGMAIRKEVLHQRGALASPATRAPGAALDKTTREALERVMAWVERTERGTWHGLKQSWQARRQTIRLSEGMDSG